MIGNINKLAISFLFILMSCKNMTQNKNDNKKHDVYINVNNSFVKYNKDTIEYYIVNKTNTDIKILCNPDFFRREKDSLLINTLCHPKLKIYDHNKLIEPSLFSVYYTTEGLDNLTKEKKTYTEIIDIDNIKDEQLTILHNYIKIIKKNDSTRFTTKIDFEHESRFYDFNEIESYILKNKNSYNLKISLNEDINIHIKAYLEKQGFYTHQIDSSRKKIKWIKTHLLNSD